ncbi:MAG TPA: hydrogenase maturation protease [Rugosimonospora sp.]|nr:hydrogenase maturation protease [Rugosimonospora sp.]
MGNIFLGDDGFGVAVARELAGRPQPDGVEVIDIGIRGIHLVHELLDGCELLVLVDAAPHGTAPGTVSVIEVGPGGAAVAARPVIDAHGLAPDDVFALLDQWQARPARTLVVACEPEDVTPGMELSAPVQAAVPEAVAAVAEILRQEAAGRVAQRRE